MNISIMSIENSLDFIKYSQNKKIDFNNINNLFGNPFFLDYHSFLMKYVYIRNEQNTRGALQTILSRRLSR